MFCQQDFRFHCRKSNVKCPPRTAFCSTCRRVLQHTLAKSKKKHFNASFVLKDEEYKVRPNGTRYTAEDLTRQLHQKEPSKTLSVTRAEVLRDVNNGYGRIIFPLNWDCWRGDSEMAQRLLDAVHRPPGDFAVLTTNENPLGHVNIHAYELLQNIRLLKRTDRNYSVELATLTQSSSMLGSCLPSLAKSNRRKLKREGFRVVIMKESYACNIPVSSLAAHCRMPDDIQEFLIIREGEVTKVDFPLYIPGSAQCQAENLTRTENRAATVLEKTLKKGDVGVVLVEFFVARTGMRMSDAMLLRIQHLCQRHDVYLVLDDTMMSLRCGRLFSFEYLDGFLPDFVILGKHWLVGLLLRILPPGPSRDHCIDLRYLCGLPTCAADPCEVLRSIHIAKLVKKHNILASCVRIGSTVRRIVEAEFGGAPGFVIHQIGSFIYTNARFGRLSTVNIEYNRLLPHFLMTDSEIKETLFPANHIESDDDDDDDDDGNQDNDNQDEVDNCDDNDGDNEG